MTQLWYTLAAGLKWSDALATMALCVSLLTFLNTGRQNRHIRALVIEEKRTALMRTVNVIRFRIKDAIGRIEEMKSLAKSRGQFIEADMEAMLEEMNKNLSSMTLVRDQLKGDRRITEIDLESRVADYEETVQMAERIIALGNRLWEEMAHRSIPQQAAPADNVGKSNPT